MSGRRCKALRRAFFNANGRLPLGTQVGFTESQSVSGLYQKKPKGFERVLDWFFKKRVKALFSMKVDTPSEWRRIKKEYHRWKRYREQRAS